MRTTLLVLGVFLMLTQAAPLVAQSQDGQKRKACRVVGMLPFNQYLVKEQRRCFNRTARAEANGFTPFVNPALGYSFSLSGDQQVPPVATAASGDCLAVLNSGETELTVMCRHDVVGASMAHVHEGAVGANGGIVCDFGNTTSPMRITCPLNESSLAALKAGNLYVNIHSLSFVSGELRGQIVNP